MPLFAGDLGAAFEAVLQDARWTLRSMKSNFGFTFVAFLILVTLLACFIPAWRAIRVNLVDVLRRE